jgi:peptidyl-prolyl cis-trans isomerase SurA
MKLSFSTSDRQTMHAILKARWAAAACAIVKSCCALIAVWSVFSFSAPLARAQAIVASINGDPVTNIDIDERMKLLRVLRKPATREAAIESLFKDRLEIHEAGKYGINPKDGDLSQQIVKVAQDLKMQPEALMAAIQGAGITPDHFKAHFRADLAFGMLVQALNKGVEASETQVREELAKQGGKAAAGTQYTVQQVIFALPNGASAAMVNERGHEADQLRARFTDCETGLAMARSLNDVTVRDPLTRTSAELGEGLRQLLDKTPTGHLTPPSRSSAGLELVAVCSKGAAKDDTAVRNAITQKLLAGKIAEDSARRLKELRDKAVIVQH